MIGLAQVLVRAPRLLLLDEPTSALDLRWQLQVLQAVRALVDEGQTLALIAVHDLNLALRFCDRIAVLGQGRVLAVASRDVQIRKAGFERFVALAAQRHGFLYGLSAVALSLLLGYGASAIFRRR